jgi:UDP-N-acetylglucosamine--N-acetylmuramyl-(pentapeptide) pyrophosphoryl-undecaprenol N-acetylglucosamine transferase
MAPSRTARLIFAGGGTGGHLYPAIAIADRLTELLKGKRQVEITFVGTERGLEYRIRDTLGYPLHLINVRGLARSLTLKNLLVPFMFVGALFQATSLLNKFRPDVVVGTGGYVAMPVLKMAAVKKIATVLQEQNSFPGITTRRLAHTARRIYLGFDEARNHLSTTSDIITTGNPVRCSIAAGDRGAAMKAFDLDPNRKTILVMGGSQGALAINNAVRKSLEDDNLPGEYQLLWQTGKRDYKEVTESLGDRVIGHALFPFAEDMAAVYAAADLAIARAGALTLAELEAVALPSILIPYPHAAGDHQRANATAFAGKGYAEVIHESGIQGADILQKARSLIESGKAAQMRENILSATSKRKPAVDIIAEDIINIIDEKDQSGGSR